MPLVNQASLRRSAAAALKQQQQARTIAWLQKQHQLAARDCCQHLAIAAECNTQARVLFETCTGAWSDSIALQLNQ